MSSELPAAPPLTPGKATEQERQKVEPLDLAQTLASCRWCWGHHPGVCPYIQRVEWHPTGQVARVVLKERPEQEAAVLYETDEEAVPEEAVK